MKERQIGKTGTFVRPIGLGCMPLSISSRPNEADGIKVLHAAFEAGTNFLDTANVYCMDDSDIGHNERLIAKAIKTWSGKNSIIVATKGGLIRPDGRWETKGSPEFLRSSCEKSLQALGVESIFLYQLHAIDDDVPMEDSVGELSKLKEEGKIQNIGISNFTPDEVERAQKVTRIESVQNRCNPYFKRDYENSMMDLCEKFEMSYLPYSTVGGNQGHKTNVKAADFEKLMAKYDATPYQLILQWHLNKSRQVIPIPGASRVESAVSSAKALEINIDPGDLKIIDQFA